MQAPVLLCVFCDTLAALCFQLPALAVMPHLLWLRLSQMHALARCIRHCLADRRWFARRRSTCCGLLSRTLRPDSEQRLPSLQLQALLYHQDCVVGPPCTSADRKRPPAGFSAAFALCCRTILAPCQMSAVRACVQCVCSHIQFIHLLGFTCDAL
jgi:hypothetical protein